MKVSISILALIAMFVAVAVTAVIAFVPTYLVGISGVRDSVATLRVNTIERAEAALLRFFATPESVAVTVEETNTAGLLTDADDPLTMARPLCQILDNLRESVSAVTLITDNSTARAARVVGCEYDANQNPVFGYSDVAPATLAGNLSRRTYNTTTKTAGDVFFSAPIVLSNLARSARLFQGRRWLPLSLGGRPVSPLLPVASSFTTGNGTLGLVRFNIKPQNCEPILRDLGLRSRARALVYDTASQRVMATSWGATFFESFEVTVFGNTSQQVRIIKNVSSLNEPLVDRVLEALGGEQGLDQLPAGYAGEVFSGKDRTFVHLADLSTRSELSARVLILMPEEDYLESIREQQTYTIIGVVCGAVVVLAFAILFSMLLKRPLVRLGHRMYLTASLRDDGVTEPKSMIAEVAQIQEAYESMRHDLQRVKAFLPQGIMRHRESSDDASAASVEFNNPLAGEQLQNHAKSAAVDTKRIAEVEPNRLMRKDCTVVLLSFGYSATTGSAEYSTLLDAVMVMLVEEAAKHRGIVETMRPDQVLISFGARKVLGNSPLHALRFAKGVSAWLEGTTKVRCWMILDRGSFLVGACGTDAFRSEVLTSTDLSILQTITPMLWRLRAPIAATGRISPSLTEGCTTIPIECVEWSASNRVHLFQVLTMTPSTNSAGDDAATTLLRRGFSLMCGGVYDQAAAVLKDAAAAAAPHANDFSPSDGIDESGIVEYVRQAAGRLCAVSLALAGTKAPYAKRFLGWASPEIFGQKADVNDRSEGPSKTEEPPLDSRVDEQLSELQKIKASISEPAVFRNTAESGLSGLDSAKASALFEMAFTATITAQEDDPSEISMGSGVRSRTGLSSSTASLSLSAWRRGKKLLGEGSFGKVYRALHDNGSIAAMKVLPLASYKTNLNDVEKELLVASKQQHDNLVNFLDSGIDQSEMIVTMEFMPGGSLTAVVNEFGTLSEKLARRVLTDVARGLAHLHNADIVHCDVKPDNVLLGLDGVSKLADFGSALHPDLQQPDIDDESLGTIRGTPAYMAPEVARGSVPGKASDIWSFGMLVHEVVTGRLPFNEQQLTEAKKGAVNCVRLLSRLNTSATSDAPEPLREQLQPSIPPDYTSSKLVSSLVSHCLQLDPARRPTCDELLSLEFFL